MLVNYIITNLKVNPSLPGMLSGSLYLKSFCCMSYFDFKGASFSVSSPSSNLARVESHVNNLDFNNKPHFPQIMNTNHDNNSEEGIESMLSDVCSPRHYSFSPREAMLDIMPGQVDYKNNPYVKPTFSFTTLICMALRSHKSHRLSLTGICKWITDNFMYYRYADPGWQVRRKRLMHSCHNSSGVYIQYFLGSRG